jgi:hypothetical protein
MREVCVMVAADGSGVNKVGTSFRGEADIPTEDSLRLDVRTEAHPQVLHSQTIQ